LQALRSHTNCSAATWSLINILSMAIKEKN
jgi:hypothetical protein